MDGLVKAREAYWAAYLPSHLALLAAVNNNNNTRNFRKAEEEQDANELAYEQHLDELLAYAFPDDIEADADQRQSRTGDDLLHHLQTLLSTSSSLSSELLQLRTDTLTLLTSPSTSRDLSKTNSPLFLQTHLQQVLLQSRLVLSTLQTSHHKLSLIELQSENSLSTALSTVLEVVSSHVRKLAEEVREKEELLGKYEENVRRGRGVERELVREFNGLRREEEELMEEIKALKFEGRLFASAR